MKKERTYDLGTVVHLDISQYPHIFDCHELLREKKKVISRVARWNEDRWEGRRGRGEERGTIFFGGLFSGERWRFEMVRRRGREEAEEKEARTHVNRNTLSTEPTRTTDTVDVVFTVPMNNEDQSSAGGEGGGHTQVNHS
jgi:hypothetical protein